MIVVFPTQRMSTIQSGSGIHHPLKRTVPRTRKTEDALKIGARRVLHHYQKNCVVHVRYE